jgi:hypothetical protein
VGEVAPARSGGVGGGFRLARVGANHSIVWSAARPGHFPHFGPTGRGEKTDTMFPPPSRAESGGMGDVGPPLSGGVGGGFVPVRGWESVT